MSKKILEQPRERSRNVYKQGDVVFARHLGLWSKATFIQLNNNGTHRIRLSRRETVDLKSYDVAPVRYDH